MPIDIFDIDIDIFDRFDLAIRVSEISNPLSFFISSKFDSFYMIAI